MGYENWEEEVAGERRKLDQAWLQAAFMRTELRDMAGPRPSPHTYPRPSDPGEEWDRLDREFSELRAVIRRFEVKVMQIRHDSKCIGCVGFDHSWMCPEHPRHHGGTY